MNIQIVLVLIGILLLVFWAVMTSLILRAAIALALVSVMLSVLMFQLGAPLAAVFELSVCAGLIPVIFISVVSLAHRLPLKEYLRRRDSRIKRFWPLPLIVLTSGAALFFVRVPLGVALPFPDAFTDVRAVLWNVKRFDLFAQIIVLLAGAYGVLVLFRQRGNDAD